MQKFYRVENNLFTALLRYDFIEDNNVIIITSKYLIPFGNTISQNHNYFGSKKQETNEVPKVSKIRINEHARKNLKLNIQLFKIIFLSYYIEKDYEHLLI